MSARPIVLPATVVAATVLAVAAAGCNSSGSAARAARPARHAAIVPHLVSVRCPDVVRSVERAVTCAHLVVAERRGDPRSRAIELFAAKAPSRSKHPASDPWVWVNGSPETFVSTGRATNARDYTDAWILEPRGADLQCPNVDAEWQRSLAKPSADRSARRALLDAAAACGRELVQEHDLDAYGAGDQAADVVDFARALGVPKLNVQGMENTTIALLVRDHPEVVRTAVVSDPIPPDVDPVGAAVSNSQRATDALARACAAVAACADRAPDVSGLARAAVADAEHDPAMHESKEVIGTIGANRGGIRVLVDGPRASNLVRLGLAQTDLLPMMPAVLAGTRRVDNATVVGSFQYPRLPWFWSEENGSLPTGALITSFCRDWLPAADVARLRAEAHDSAYAALAADFSLDLCTQWPVHPAPESRHTPVRSSVPALVFTGEFSPFVPSAWGDRFVKNMPNGRHLVVPARGGNPFGSGEPTCPKRVRLAFLRNPAAPLDTSCIDAMPDLAFVTKAGS